MSKSRRAKSEALERAPRVHVADERVGKMPLPRPMNAGQTVVVIPTVSHLVSDGLSILRRELVKLRAASERNEELSEGQTKKLARYVRALGQLAAEEREQAAIELGDMSDEDVVAELLENPDMRELISAHLRALENAQGD